MTKRKKEREVESVNASESMDGSCLDDIEECDSSRNSEEFECVDSVSNNTYYSDFANKQRLLDEMERERKIQHQQEEKEELSPIIGFHTVPSDISLCLHEEEDEIECKGKYHNGECNEVKERNPIYTGTKYKTLHNKYIEYYRNFPRKHISKLEYDTHENYDYLDSYKDELTPSEEEEEEEEEKERKHEDANHENQKEEWEERNVKNQTELSITKEHEEIKKESTHNFTFSKSQSAQQLYIQNMNQSSEKGFEESSEKLCSLKKKSESLDLSNNYITYKEYVLDPDLVNKNHHTSENALENNELQKSTKIVEEENPRMEGIKVTNSLKRITLINFEQEDKESQEEKREVEKEDYEYETHRNENKWNSEMSDIESRKEPFFEENLYKDNIFANNILSNSLFDDKPIEVCRSLHSSMMMDNDDTCDMKELKNVEDDFDRMNDDIISHSSDSFKLKAIPQIPDDADLISNDSELLLNQEDSLVGSFGSYKSNTEESNEKSHKSLATHQMELNVSNEYSSSGEDIISISDQEHRSIQNKLINEEEIDEEETNEEEIDEEEMNEEENMKYEDIHIENLEQMNVSEAFENRNLNSVYNIFEEMNKKHEELINSKQGQKLLHRSVSADEMNDRKIDALEQNDMPYLRSKSIHLLFRSYSLKSDSSASESYMHMESLEEPSQREKGSLEKTEGSEMKIRQEMKQEDIIEEEPINNVIELDNYDNNNKKKSKEYHDNKVHEQIVEDAKEEEKEEEEDTDMDKSKKATTEIGKEERISNSYKEFANVRNITYYPNEKLDSMKHLVKETKEILNNDEIRDTIKCFVNEKQQIISKKLFDFKDLIDTNKENDDVLEENNRNDSSHSVEYNLEENQSREENSMMDIEKDEEEYESMKNQHIEEVGKIGYDEKDREYNRNINYYNINTINNNEDLEEQPRIHNIIKIDTISTQEAVLQSHSTQSRVSYHLDQKNEALHRLMKQTEEAHTNESTSYPMRQSQSIFESEPLHIHSLHKDQQEMNDRNSDFSFTQNEIMEHISNQSEASSMYLEKDNNNPMEEVACKMEKYLKRYEKDDANTLHKMDSLEENENYNFYQIRMESCENNERFINEVQKRTNLEEPYSFENKQNEFELEKIRNDECMQNETEQMQKERNTDNDTMVRLEQKKNDEHINHQNLYDRKNQNREINNVTQSYEACNEYKMDSQDKNTHLNHLYIINNLNEQIRVIKQENEDLKKEREHIINENEILRNERDGVQDENVHLKNEREIIVNENVKLENERDIARSNHAILKKEQASILNEKEQLKTEMDVLKKNVELLKEECNQLKNDNVMLNNENVNLKKDNTNLKNDNEHLIIENRNLKVDRETIKNQKENINNEKDNLLEENEMLRSDNESLSRDKYKLRTEIEDLKKANETVNNSFEEFKKEKEELQHKYEELSNTYESLHKNHEQLKEEKEILHEEHVKLRETYKSLYNANEELINENEILQDKYEELKNNYDSLYENHEQLKEERKGVSPEEFIELQKNYESIHKEHEKIKKDQEMLHGEYEELQKKYNLLYDKNEQLMSEKEILHTNFENGNRRCTYLCNENEKLETEKKILCNQYEQLKNNYETLCQDHEKLKEDKQKEVLHNEYEQLKEAHESINKDNQKLKKEIEVLLKECEQLKGEKETLHNEYTQLKDIYESLHENNGQLKEEQQTLYNKHEEIKEEYELLHDSSKQLEKEKEILHNEYEKLKNSYEALYKNNNLLREEKGMILNEYEQLTYNYRSLHEKEKEDEEHTVLHNEYTQLKNTYESIHNEYKKIKEEKEWVQKEYEKLKEGYESLCEKNKEIINEKEVLYNENTNLKKTNEHLCREKEMLQSNIKKFKEENEENKNRYTNTQEEYNKVKESYNQYKMKCHQLESEILEKDTQNKEQQETYQKKIEFLNDEIKKVIIEKDQLGAAYQMLERECTTLKQQIQNVIQHNENNLKIIEQMQIERAEQTRETLNLQMGNIQLQKEKEMTQKENQMLQQSDQKNLSEVHLLKEEKEKWKIEEMNHMTKIKELEEQVTQGKNYISNLEKEINRLNNTLEKLRKEMFEKEEQECKSKEEIQMYKENYETNKNEIEDMKEQITNYETELEILRMELHQIQDEKEYIQQNVENLKKENELLKEENRVMKHKEEYATNNQDEMNQIDLITYRKEHQRSSQEQPRKEKQENKEEEVEDIHSYHHECINSLHESDLEYIHKQHFPFANNTQKKEERTICFQNYKTLCKEIYSMSSEELKLKYIDFIKEYIFLQSLIEQYEKDAHRKNHETNEEDMKRTSTNRKTQVSSTSPLEEKCSNEEIRYYKEMYVELQKENKKLVERLENMIKVFIRNDNEEESMYSIIIKKILDISKHIDMINEEINNWKGLDYVKKNSIVKNDLDESYYHSLSMHNNEIDFSNILLCLNYISADILFINSKMGTLSELIYENRVYLYVHNMKQQQKQSYATCSLDSVQKKSEDRKKEVNMVVGAFVRNEPTTNRQQEEVSVDGNTNEINNKEEESENLQFMEHCVLFFEICLSSDFYLMLVHICKGINEISKYARIHQIENCKVVITNLKSQVESLVHFYSPQGNTCFMDSFIELFTLFNNFLQQIESIVLYESVDVLYKILYEIDKMKKLIRLLLLSFFNFHMNDTESTEAKRKQTNTEKTLEENQEFVMHDNNHKEISQEQDYYTKPSQTPFKQINRLMNHYIKEWDLATNRNYSNRNAGVYPLNSSSSFSFRNENSYAFQEDPNRKDIEKLMEEITEFNYHSHVLPTMISNYIDEMFLQNNPLRSSIEIETKRVHGITRGISKYMNQPSLGVTNTSTSSALLEKESYALTILKKINEHMKLDHLIVKSSEFIEYFEEEEFRHKMETNPFFKKNHSINVDIIYKYLSIIFKMNVGIDYNYFYEQFLILVSNMLIEPLRVHETNEQGNAMMEQPNINTATSHSFSKCIMNSVSLNKTPSSISQSLLGTLPNNSMQAYVKNKSFSSKNGNILSDSSFCVRYPLMQCDNFLMSVLFHMWQQIEIHYFSKLKSNQENQEIKYGRDYNKLNPSQQQRHPYSSSMHYSYSLKSSDRYGSLRKLKSELMQKHEKGEWDQLFRSMDKKRKASNNETQPKIGKGSEDVDTGITNHMDDKEEDTNKSVEEYVKLMIFDIFKCKNSKKEIGIDDFIYMFKQLQIHIKTSVLYSIWCIIIGNKNITTALKQRVPVSVFIKKAYTTNPSLIFYEYCKAKVELREAKRSIKLLQQYNKKLHLLVKV